MIVVYTAVFGGYDAIRPPRFNSDVKYVIFTDKDVKVKDAEVRVVKPIFSARKTSRYYKILAHQLFPDAEYTIWHGGWLQLIKNPIGLLKYLGDHDIAMEPHLERDCIYDEANVVIQRRLANQQRVRDQMRKYRREGFPAHYGLTSCFLIVRHNTPKIAEFEKVWWNQIHQHTNRDQLSCMYSMWRTGIDYGRIPQGARSHGFYRTHKHR